MFGKALLFSRKTQSVLGTLVQCCLTLGLVWFIIRGRHCASLRMIQEPLPGQVQTLPRPGELILLGSGTHLGADRSRGISSCGVSCCSSG